MRFSLFFGRRLQSSGSFTATIVKMAIVAVGLSLAVMIGTVCIVTGFRGEIRDKVTGFVSHIRISRADNNDSFDGLPVACSTSFIDSVKKVPGVLKVQPFAYKPGIIKTKELIEGIVIKGIDSNYDQKFFKEHLLEGNELSFDSLDEKQMLISKTTASRLNLKVGGKLNIYFIGEHLTARQFKVKGIYETGMEEFDKLFALGSLKTVRKLNGWDSTMNTGLELMIQNTDSLDHVNLLVNRILPLELNASSMGELYPQIFEWLSIVDTNVYVIISIMAIIALITMITTFIVLIIERTPMIGLLKSMGARNMQVSGVFFQMASAIILKGLVWGNILGIGFCYIQEKWHIIQLDQQNYYMKYVPIHFDWSYIIFLNIATLIICMIFMLVPARLIALIQPLSAIKFR